MFGLLWGGNLGAEAAAAASARFIPIESYPIANSSSAQSNRGRSELSKGDPEAGTADDAAGDAAGDAVDELEGELAGDASTAERARRASGGKRRNREPGSCRGRVAARGCAFRSLGKSCRNAKSHLGSSRGWGEALGARRPSLHGLPPPWVGSRRAYVESPAQGRRGQENASLPSRTSNCRTGAFLGQMRCPRRDETSRPSRTSRREDKAMRAPTCSLRATPPRRRCRGARAQRQRYRGPSRTWRCARIFALNSERRKKNAAASWGQRCGGSRRAPKRASGRASGSPRDRGEIGRSETPEGKLAAARVNKKPPQTKRNTSLLAQIMSVMPTTAKMMLRGEWRA